MLDNFDIETLADKTIETLSVRAGQVIWIWASTASLDFIEALAFRIRAQGAFWTLRLTMESLLRRIGQDLREPYLGLIPEHELRWLDDIDATVDVRDHGGHIPGVSASRRRAMASEWIALIDEANRRGHRQVTVLNPTAALAAAYRLPLVDLREACWQAINIDYGALDQQGEQLRRRIAETTAVRVASPLGTNLQMRVDQRPVHVDKDSLPRGKVYLAPHEDSANGVAVIDKTFIRGNPVEQLRLTLIDGHVVETSAPKAGAVDAFRELLSGSSGDKDVIAEFAIGLNPGLTEPVGDSMLDEKIGGSVHIALGMNQAFGGQNRSNLHLDLVILAPTVWLDDSLVVADGTLTM